MIVTVIFYFILALIEVPCLYNLGKVLVYYHESDILRDTKWKVVGIYLFECYFLLAIHNNLVYHKSDNIWLVCSTYCTDSFCYWIEL